MIPSAADLEPGRARREVHERQRRLHHRRPLLQGTGEQQHAHRQPVDVDRHAARRPRRSRARRATGWQQVLFGEPGGDHRQHDLRRLVPHQRRRLRGRRRVLRARAASIRRRCTRRPARCRAATGCSPTARRSSRRRPSTAPTTGWTSSSRRASTTRRRRSSPRSSRRSIDSSRVTITWTTNEDATSKIEYSTDPALLDEHLVAAAGDDHGQPVGIRDAAQRGAARAWRRTRPTTIASSRSTAPATPRTSPHRPSRCRARRSAIPVRRTSRPARRQRPTSPRAANGEVMLAPTAGSEFSGTAMSPGWTLGAVGYRRLRERRPTGNLLVDGSRVGTCVDNGGGCQSSRPNSRDTVSTSSRPSAATRSSTPASASCLTGAPWAIFSTSTGGTLFARSLSRRGPRRQRRDPERPDLPRAVRTATAIDWQATARRLLHRRRAGEVARLRGRRPDASDRGQRLQRLRRQHRRRLDAHVAVRRDRHVRVARVRRRRRR